MVWVHAVLRHQQPVDGGPLEAPVPSRAKDDGGRPAAAVLRRRRRPLGVEVLDQRERHLRGVVEAPFPLLLGPHEEQVLGHPAREGAEPGARGGEEGGLGPGVARLRAARALAPLAAELPAYTFPPPEFFGGFRFIFVEEEREWIARDERKREMKERERDERERERERERCE